MALTNLTVDKLIAEGKVSYLSEEEARDTLKFTYERPINTWKTIRKVRSKGNLMLSKKPKK